MNLPDDKKKRGRRVPDEVRGAPLSERALLDSHETLCSILATTRDGYWHVDADFKLIDVNAVYCQQSGYAHEPGCGFEPVLRLDKLEGWPGEKPLDGEVDRG